MSENILTLEEEKLDELLKVNYLTPSNAVFHKTDGGFAALTFNGTDYGHVNIIRTFPFSAPDEFLSVRKINGKNEEIGIIENINIFDTDTVSLINKQLEIRYFMPEILKIISIKEEYGHAYWTVLTNKGTCKFTSAAGSSGAVIQLDKRVIIKDSSENRYEIKDISLLSQKELKRLELYL